MATIVCDSKKFVFVHIPKCAGMSISVQLKELVDWDPRFTGAVLYDHSKLGKIMAAHLPLQVVRDYYPRTFPKYLEYETYAVLRDPRARFVSAMAQHLREFRDRDMYDLKPRELEAAIDDVVGQMAKTPIEVPVEYVHFTRQYDYVFLDGERIVQNLYTTGTLGAFARDLADRHDVHLDAEESKNKTVGYKSRGVKRLMHAGGSVARTILPNATYEAIRQKARGAAMVTTSNKRPDAFESSTVRDFVDEFYADDFTLWQNMPAIARTGSHQDKILGEKRDA